MRVPPANSPVIRIANATFYRHPPTSTRGIPNPPLFSNLNFELPSTSPSQNWCIVGPSLSGKTTFLEALRSKHYTNSPQARRYPYLNGEDVPDGKRRSPSSAIQYVGFDANNSALGVAASSYVSARYESLREDTDFSVRNYLLDNMSFNNMKLADDEKRIDDAVFDKVVAELKLQDLLDLPVAFLSNGQGRRARIARALIMSPEVLLLDEPFMGLDPPTTRGLSPFLEELAEKASPRLVLSARPQDPLPEWITHLVYLRTDCQVGAMGERGRVLDQLREYVRGVWKGGVREDGKLPVHALGEMGRVLTRRGVEGEGFSEEVGDEVGDEGNLQEGIESKVEKGVPVVEMEGCTVKYGDKLILGGWKEKRDGQVREGLHWTVRQGERWGVFGPNGCGKTTLVSLLCSDHPQAYSLPIKLFGRSRLPEPGSGQFPLTYWDIQARIGHSSPEIHQHIPPRLTVRQVLESAWANTFLSKPDMDDAAKGQVDATLRWFAPELCSAPTKDQVENYWTSTPNQRVDWAEEHTFRDLSFSAQRILLFLRAIVKHPPIVVLDEAFSGMDEAVRDKCLLWLSHGNEKRYLTGFSKSGSSGKHSPMEASVVDNTASKPGHVTVKVKGLGDEQALICISHIKEEIPDSVKNYIILPQPNSGVPARFGRVEKPLRTDAKTWWGVWDAEKK